MRRLSMRQNAHIDERVYEHEIFDRLAVWMIVCIVYERIKRISEAALSNQLQRRASCPLQYINL